MIVLIFVVGCLNVLAAFLGGSAFNLGSAMFCFFTVALLMKFRHKF